MNGVCEKLCYVVGQHERARLDHKLERLFVAGDGSGKTGSWTRLSARVNGSRRELFYLPLILTNLVSVLLVALKLLGFLTLESDF